MKGDRFYRFNIILHQINYNKELVGFSFLDYFCDHPNEDVAFEALMTCRKQVLEKAVKGYKFVPETNNSFCYLVVDELRTTHKVAEPLTIFFDTNDPKKTIFVHYGYSVIKDSYIRKYGLWGLEVIANSTHNQPKQTRLKRARLLWDYLHKITWLS